MIIHASHVGVHATRPNPRKVRACVRCGARRSTKGDTALCSACARVTAALGEREKWEQR